MTLATLVAGAYSGTYNAVALGIQENGFELQFEPHEKLVNQSDAYGETIIDALYTGADHYLQFTGLSYGAGMTAPMWPFGTLGVMGIIGRLHSALAMPIVLTATAGTPAATAPATLTGPKSLLAANANPKLLFTTEVRKVPIRLRLHPNDPGSGAVWFTTT